MSNSVFKKQNIPPYCIILLDYTYTKRIFEDLKIESYILLIKNEPIKTKNEL